MTTHHFQPTVYYNSFGSHPPVLRIASGDSVVTHTIDARGNDAAGNHVGNHPNPETGPFYIEGAEPGDTLAVRLDYLYPDREGGYTSSVLAPHMVDPGYAARLPEREMLPWRMLPQANRAVLAAPVPGLANFSLPLSPMLGCLGVAPEGGQIISSATSGPYGGNMDYRGCVAGSTLYFPVGVPGALLHLGDGHAAQGDGEVVGTGIEISFAVRFRVELIKGKVIGWPRGENEDSIFTLGNARPLEQAVQHATTEMLRWLQEDYGLEVTAASTLLGMCVHYDLGNIYDPAYTMVCRLSKRLLESIRLNPQG
jgi:acetamidase/formamidase